MLHSPRERTDVRQSWKNQKVQAMQSGSDREVLNQMARKLEAMRRRMLGGGGAVSGWHRPTSGKYNVDPTVDYDSDSIIHVPASSTLVTVGIRDAANPTGALVQSCAGLWVALQTVPAKKVVSGNEVWNLPQFPYPVTTDTLVMDDPMNFWYYLGEMNC